MKAEVDKFDINKLTVAPLSLDNLETKVDDLDVGKLKAVPVDLQKLSINKEIPGATTLIHISQSNTDQQKLEKKMEMLIKNATYKWFSDYNCFEYKY